MAVISREQLDAIIREKAAADPGLADRLRSAPRGTLYELTGMVLPDGVTVEVHEETLTHIHLVVPAPTSEGEIAEDDLELVAGGTSCWDNCGCSV